MSSLAVAPDVLLDESGAPRFGAYAGRIRDTALRVKGSARGRARVEQFLSEKRWHYACVASQTLVVGGAVLQLGYLGAAFVYVFDRRERRLLVDRSFVLPPNRVDLDDLAAEARGEARWLGRDLLIEASRSAGRFWGWPARRLGVEVLLRMDLAPEPLTAVCPGRAGVTMTQKTSCIPAAGEVVVGPNTFRMTDGIGSLDYSHGLYPRSTEWRWASAFGRLEDGRAVGVNLVEGHNDGEISENGIWIDGRLRRVGRARFGYTAGAWDRPWSLETEDGAVKLEFRPEGVREQRIDLRIFKLQYAQPIGVFNGTLVDESGERVVVRDVPGVVEDHRSRW